MVREFIVGEELRSVGFNVGVAASGLPVSLTLKRVANNGFIFFALVSYIVRRKN